MAIYLDYNATAPTRPEAAEVMREILAAPANPSSMHRFGREAKKNLEDARKTIADAISAFPNEIIFTASGSEANNMVLKGFPGRKIIASSIEHSSVLKHAPCLIPVDGNGVVDLAALDAMLSTSEPALVSIMLANNETGVIQPIADIAAICKKHSALLHTDAVQALGKIPVDFGLLGADMMTLSAHKCGGPVGAACLVIKQNLPIQPLIAGGGQELNRRAGTENIAAIAGFAKAVELFDFSHMQKLRGWLDAMEATISPPPAGEDQGGGILQVRDPSIVPPPNPPPQGGRALGKSAPRLPNTSCIVMPGISSEVQLMDFDLKGFAVSAGSACSSGRIEVSHVLRAMALPENITKCAIRISGGWKTTENDIISFAIAWKQTYKRLLGNS